MKNIYFENKACGKVCITHEDMNVIFDITCEILSLNITRVYLKSKTNVQPLGVLMPKNNSYVLTKKIPKHYLKNIDFDDLNFWIEIENFERKITKIPEDKNLANSLCDEIIKTEHENHDTYEFKFYENRPFYFNFCFTKCIIIDKNNEKYVELKTDKNGNIKV